MSDAYRHRWAASVALLCILSGTVGIAGCGPSGATAAESITKPPAAPVGGPASPAPPAEQSEPRQARPAAELTSTELPKYVLPFEARANPFAPPKPTPNDRSATAATKQTVDVKLVGLMSNDTGSMAVVEVDGRPFVVFAGTSLDPPSGAESLNVVEIRESEIVVEQGGRQWVVPLPRP